MAPQASAVQVALRWHLVFQVGSPVRRALGILARVYLGLLWSTLISDTVVYGPLVRDETVLERPILAVINASLDWAISALLCKRYVNVCFCSSIIVLVE